MRPVPIDMFLSWKYKEGGRIYGEVDCFGLVFHFAFIHGVIIPQGIGLDNFERGGTELLKRLPEYVDEIEAKELRYGDIVLFLKAGLPVHIAVYLSDGLILDCSEKFGIARRELDEQPLNRTKKRYYRFRSC